MTIYSPPESTWLLAAATPPPAPLTGRVTLTMSSPAAAIFRALLGSGLPPAIPLPLSGRLTFAGEDILGLAVAADGQCAPADTRGGCARVRVIGREQRLQRALHGNPPRPSTEMATLVALAASRSLLPR